MEVPSEKEMKSPKRGEVQSLKYDLPKNWVVDNIKTEPVEEELVTVKSELDDPGTETNNERLRANVPLRVSSIDQQRFVVDGAAPESMWPGDIAIGQVKIEPADESDDPYANAANGESSIELSDARNAETKGATLNDSREMRKMLLGPRVHRMEVNQQKDERARCAVRGKMVTTENMFRQAPRSTEPIGRPPPTHDAIAGKAHVPIVRQQYRCEVCSMEYKTKISLEIHTSLRHRDNLEELPFHPCSECANSYAHPQQLKRHLLTHKHKTCPECGIKVSYYNFRQHLANHEPNQPRFRCELCSRSYKTARYLREHIAVKHPSDDRHCRTYVCGECDKEFVNSIQFKFHRRNHRLSSRVCCQFCFKSYSRKWLNVHIASEHAPGGKVPRKR